MERSGNRIQGCGSRNDSRLTRTFRYASALLRLLKMLHSENSPEFWDTPEAGLSIDGQEIPAYHTPSLRMNRGLSRVLP